MPRLTAPSSWPAAGWRSSSAPVSRGPYRTWPPAASRTWVGWGWCVGGVCGGGGGLWRRAPPPRPVQLDHTGACSLTSLFSSTPSGVAIQRRISTALATGLAAHTGTTGRQRILDQLSKLRRGGADGELLYAAVTRPTPALLAQPETLRALQAMSAEGWQLLFFLLERSTRPEPATSTDAPADAAMAAQLSSLPEVEAAGLIHLLAATSESVRAAFVGLGSGLLRCDARSRGCTPAIYARDAPRGAGDAAEAAAESRAQARNGRLEDALLLVCGDQRLAALLPLLRPGWLCAASVRGLLSGVITLRRSDAAIGATHLDLASDWLDSAQLALNEDLGQTVRPAEENSTHCLAHT